MDSNKIQQYSKNEISNKDGFELILEAFNAIVRGMEKGKKAIEEKDYLEQNRVLNACSNLLVELRNSLPPSDNFSELRTSLNNIFTYADKTISEANRTANPALLTKVEEMFSKMYTQTDNMKLLPNFKEIQKQNQDIIDAPHSAKRVSLQIDTTPENEDIIQFLDAYQASNYKKMSDLENSTKKNTEIE